MGFPLGGMIFSMLPSLLPRLSNAVDGSSQTIQVLFYFVANAIYICLELLYFVLRSVTQRLDGIDDLSQDTVKGMLCSFPTSCSLLVGVAAILGFPWVGRLWAIREGSFCPFLVFFFHKRKGIDRFLKVKADLSDIIV